MQDPCFAIVRSELILGLVLVAACSGGDRRYAEPHAAGAAGTSRIAVHGAVAQEATVARQPRRAREPQPNTARGNVLLEDLAIHEAVGIVGTPVAFVYQSDRAAGYGDGYDVSIPLLGDKVPSKLKSVAVVVDIAGTRESKTLTPAKHLSHTHHWDGKDAAGRTMQSEQKADIWVGYGFTGVVATSVSEEAQAGPSEEVTGTAPSVVLWRKHHVLLGIYDARGLGLGRFTLNVQHAYNPETGVLYFGNGRKRSADDTRLLAVAADLPDKEAREARHILSADSMAVAADGSVYTSDDPDEGKGPPRVWHITA